MRENGSVPEAVDIQSVFNDSIDTNGTVRYGIVPVHAIQRVFETSCQNRANHLHQQLWDGAGLQRRRPQMPYNI